MNQEQLKGTEAKISCIVNGLTKALDEVKWTDSDGTLITSGSNNYVIEEGDLIGNTQTTVLTVPAALNTQDTTFNCLITSNEHAKVDDKTTVSLKVFSKYHYVELFEISQRHHGGDAVVNILISRFNILNKLTTSNEMSQMFQLSPQ